MATVSRREFARYSLGSLLTYSLLETLYHNDAFGAAVKPETEKWLLDVHRLGQDLKVQKLKQTQWQEQVEALFGKVDLPDLLRAIDFDRLAKGLELPERGARQLGFKFPKVEGLPTNLVFGKQIFAMKKGRSVVPHGHNNMATAFLILKGNFHGRHYDRVHDEPEHMLIKPTIDRSFAAGEHSSISDDKDNVHWFLAKDEPAFIFNIHVMNIRPKKGEPTGRVYVDPNGEKVRGDLVRAPLLDYEEAHRRYG